MKFKNENLQKKLNTYLSAGLCLLLLIVVAVSFFVPLISTADFTMPISLSAFDFMRSRSINDLNFGLYGVLNVSYYICKYFYLLFAFVTAGMLLLLAYYFISRNKNFQKHTNNIMLSAIIFLFISMLAGINLVSIYSDVTEAQSHISGFFIAGMVLLVLKFVSASLLGESPAKDELKDSGQSLVFSFVLFFLALCSLLTPIYIFPGTVVRIHGVDLLFNNNHLLSNLPISNIFRTAYLISTIALVASFALTVVFFKLRRNMFIRYNKYNNLFGLFYVAFIAFVGLSYLWVYIDAKGYLVFPATSMNTYSFIPLLLYALFRLGVIFTKLTASNLNVEYKIYAQSLESGGGASASQNNAGIADPIPAFSELDKRADEFAAEYAQRMQKHFNGLTLPALVSHVIEYAANSSERLSYSSAEIKTFIAGIAASKLSILQGMSGTGKTSLPKIFMEAINGCCEIVAVESSWRDKNELLGYYNEFTKKYTPKSFTQFLYAAALNKDVPYFIVLDEMNLSRIEYYFSDFLSLMESRENMRQIKLFDVQLYPDAEGGSQYLALKGGHTIAIPPNVWFVGTANRDESTFEISDKVYDRAQTMSFDRRAPKIVSEQINFPQRFVPYKELRALFDKAKVAQFDAENYDAIQKIEVLLRPYKISFGNRILKQIEEFVKIYVACSDVQTESDRRRYVHEAVDCMILSKIVRKLELKQIPDAEELINEFAKLQLPKCEEFLHALTETE